MHQLCSLAQIKKYPRTLGQNQIYAYHCVYVRRFPNGKFIILLLYVNDMLIVGQDADMVMVV